MTGGTAVGESGRPLKVLAVNKYYYLRGGAERYFFELSRMLEGRGHEVVPFSMEDPENEPSAHADLFVSPSDFDNRRGLWVRFSEALQSTTGG